MGFGDFPLILAGPIHIPVTIPATIPPTGVPGVLDSTGATGEPTPPPDAAGDPEEAYTWEDLERDFPEVFVPAQVDPERERWETIIRTPVPDAPQAPQSVAGGPGVLDTQKGDEEKPVDWGDIFAGAARGAIGAVLPQGSWDPFATLPGIAGNIMLGATGNLPTVPGQPVMNPPDAAAACGVRTVPGPRYLTYDCRTGQLLPKRRRRRRRLLTPTDLSDLAALAGVIGKGSQGMNLAVARAVGGSR